jgi:hypothetical protein
VWYGACMAQPGQDPRTFTDRPGPRGRRWLRWQASIRNFRCPHCGHRDLELVRQQDGSYRWLCDTCLATFHVVDVQRPYHQQ